MLCIVKKTLDTITATKNHYVVGIKRNKPTLYKAIEKVAEYKSSALEYFSEIEVNKGRLEYRRSEVFKTSDDIKEILPHARSVIKVLHEVINKEKYTYETLYYLSDLELTATEFHKGIRGHWQIEIKLHYVKDVVMNEDNGHIKNPNLASIFSLIRSYVISISKIFDNSVTNFQRTYAHNPDFIAIL